ncbi:MAG: metallophosphoesterase family protein [Candidatus Omnitrophota bacterium]
MRYGIFSDIHSNLEAFEEVVKAYKKEKIDRYLCLGDIVGYAANPKECIAKTKQLKAVVVAGNHDWAAVGLTDTTYFRPVAKQAVFWTAGQLDKTEKDYLKSLSLVYDNEELTIVHGALNEPESFHYLLDSVLAEETFNLMKNNICFIGHSHEPGIFVRDKEKISYFTEPKIKKSKDKKYIVNVGSVGQPRDRDNRAAYCVFDTEKKEVYLKRIKYDIEKAQIKIVNAGLPAFLAARLASGI